MRIFGIVLLLQLCNWACQSAMASDVKYAFIARKASGDDVFLMSSSGEIRRISSDEKTKSLPIISPSGRYVAWQEPGLSDSVSDLLIADVYGRLKAHILIEPREGMQYAAPLRSIDKIIWVSDSKIAVEGSADPSLCRHVLYETKLDKSSAAVTSVSESLSDFADGNAREAADCAASFSPDGKHFAAVDMLPHFSVPESRSEAYTIQTPRIIIDYAAVKVHLGYSFIMTPLHWSENNVLFYVDRQLPSGEDVLVAVKPTRVEQVGKTFRFSTDPIISKIYLGKNPTDDLRLTSQGDNVFVSTFKSGHVLHRWSAAPDNSSHFTLMATSLEAASDTTSKLIADSKLLRGNLRKRLSSDVTQIDVFFPSKSQVRVFPDAIVSTPYHADMH